MEGESHYVNIRLPFITVRGECAGDTLNINGKPAPGEHSLLEFPLDLEAVSLGDTILEFSLFGYIPIQEMNVNVVPEIKAVPGGHSIGISLHSDGVMVVGFYQVASDGGLNLNPGRSAGIRIGDLIVAVEGHEVRNIEHTFQLLQEYASKGALSVTLKRNQQQMHTTIYPQYCNEDNEHRIGVYIRDTTVGVGTLSFYEPQTLRFGALGHIIMDTDTGNPVDMGGGEIVKANIININAAKRGTPGEKTGVFMEDDGFRGNIDKNTHLGIYGYLEEPDDSPTPYSTPIPVALASQVQEGEAKMLTVIDGETIKSYDLKIERVNKQFEPADKGMVVQITDDELLNKTGGIVQGMSGSPIIQDDKLVGVITHVFVNDPSRGYGLFAEWMVYEAGLTS